MSETTTDDATQGAPQGDTAPQPATETAPPPGTEQATPTEPQTAAEPPKPDPRDRAIRQMAFEARENKRQLQAATEALAKLNPPDPNAPPTQAELDRLVDQRATVLVEQRETQARSTAWIAAGNADFPDFTERCNTLADLGAGSNAAFMAAVSKIGAAHKVVAELASNPGEAVRVLALPPVDMAVELAAMSYRIGAAQPPPKPTTQAPPPIRPITGTARAEPDPSKMDGDEYLRWFREQRVKARS